MLAFNWLSVPVGIGVVIGGFGLLLAIIFVGTWLAEHETIILGLIISIVVGVAMVVGGGIMHDTTTQVLGGILAGVSLCFAILGSMFASLTELLEEGR